MKAILFLFLSLLFLSSAYKPVVVMHGILSYASSMNGVVSWIESDYPGIYVKNIEIGNGWYDSLYMDINKQVESFAQQVASDPKLNDGFNLIGYSQGGLITRAYIEKYNNPKVYNYISWVGPHDGVYGTPDLNVWCPDNYCPWLDDVMNALYNNSWTDGWIQSHISFAAYWKDPFNYDSYLTHSHFLADINNERDQKNQTYRNNILSLNSITLIHSTVDNIVIPNTSPWFQFYAVGQDVNVVPFQKTDQFMDDWLGLKTQFGNNKLLMYAVPCEHARFPSEECKTYYTQYTKPMLNN